MIANLDFAHLTILHTEVISHKKGRVLIQQIRIFYIVAWIFCLKLIYFFMSHEFTFNRNIIPGFELASCFIITCIRMGIRVVGKGIWKEREVRKFVVGKSEVGKIRWSRKEPIGVGKFELKLESSGWSWKVQLKLESDLWSWKV